MHPGRRQRSLLLRRADCCVQVKEDKEADDAAPAKPPPLGLVVQSLITAWDHCDSAPQDTPAMVDAINYSLGAGSLGPPCLYLLFLV